MAAASSSTFYSFVPDSTQSKTQLALQPFNLNYSCDDCHERIKRIVFQCVYCTNYHLCEHCHETSLHHSDATVHPENTLKPDCFFTKIIKFAEPQILLHKSYAHTLLDAFMRFEKRSAVGVYIANNECNKPISGYEWIKYKKLHMRIGAFGSEFCKLISSIQDPFINCSMMCACLAPLVIVWMPNCIEWIIADAVCLMRHCVVIPIDVQTPLDLVVRIMKQCRASILITDVSRYTQLKEESTKSGDSNKVADFPVADFSLVVLCGTTDFDKNREQIDNSKKNVYLFEDIEAKGLGSTIDIQAVSSPDCCVSIIYTSGTTGTACKGAVVTDHALNRRAQANIIDQNFTLASYISFCNSAGRHQLSRTLCNGGKLGLIQDTRYLMERITLIRPSLLAAPPLIWNTIYKLFLDDLNQGCTRLIALGKTRSRLGGNLTEVSVGGAKSDLQIVSFLKECFSDGLASDGYGTTETGSIASDDVICDHVQVELLDVPDLGFFKTDQPHPRGEICVRTPNMILQYYNEPELTLSAFTTINNQQFYRTGDIGELTNKGTKVNVIDRVKHFFKLNNGVFISPERIETVYALHCESIETIYIYSTSSFSVLAAVIIPKTLGTDLPDDYWLKELQVIGQQHRLQPYEIPCVIMLETNVSTIAHCFTSTMKKKRHQWQLNYQSKLERLLLAHENQKQSFNTFSSSSLVDPFDVLLQCGLSGPYDKSFNELGGTSMVAIQFMHCIRKHPTLGNLQLSQLLEAKSLQELFLQKCALVDDSNTAGHGLDRSLDTRDDIKQENCLISQWQQLTPRRPMSITSPFTVLLTGATGFLGIYLLAGLLERFKDCQVISLIRAHSTVKNSGETLASTALHRIQLNAAKYNLKLDESRIEAIYADVTNSNNLGLSKETYDQIAQRIHFIVHNAAWVNYLYPYSQLKAANTDSTVNLLQLAAHGSKRFCFISSISTVKANLDNSKRTPLDWNIQLTMAPSKIKMVPDMANGYAYSKWKSEQLIERVNQPRDCYIVRPFTIIEHSETKIPSANQDMLSALIHGITQLQCLPSCFQSHPTFQSKRYLVTVDQVVSQILSTMETRMSCEKAVQSNETQNEPSPLVYASTSIRTTTLYELLTIRLSAPRTSGAIVNCKEWNSILYNLPSTHVLAPFREHLYCICLKIGLCSPYNMNHHVFHFNL